ncbi:MAG: HEAT repeat domain-containing protein [Chloroflexus sp.]|uniref:HEAT repeat domain-containing protein n=1 Tax=Chloroflexus sp. TaxID=1904827 RepID=UPI0030996E47
MIPPALQQVLQRLGDGTYMPADLEAVRIALQQGLISRTVTVDGNTEQSVIVTGDGKVVLVLHGSAAEQVNLADLTGHYLDTVIKDWKNLTITAHGEDRKVPLTGVFFMLQARPRPEKSPSAPPSPDLDPTAQRLADAGYDTSAYPDPARDGERHADDRERKPPPPPLPPVPLETVLQTGDHLVILGEPGAGKSTALQYIGLAYAGAVAQRPVAHITITQPAIPVHLRLQVSASTIAQRTVRAALVAEVCDRLQCEPDKAEALLNFWKVSPGLLILLDGLDEVPTELRAQVRERIERLVRSGFGRVIVSSRPAGFLTLGGMSEYMLKPFEDAGQEALPYLQGWLRVLQPAWDGIVVENKARALIEQMQARPALRRLLNNPLLLRLSAQHYVANDEIARNCADLYRQWVAEAWARARQRGAAEQDEKTYLHALQVLAWHLHCGGDNSEPALRDALRAGGLATDERAATDLLHRLRGQTGLLAWLREVENGRPCSRYVFSHQTLREYLVAQRLLKAWQQDARRTWRFLRPRLHLPEWREPLALLAGLLSAGEAQHLLTWILRAHSPAERVLRRDLLLAAELAAESGQVQAIERLLLPGLRRALKQDHLRERVAEALAKLGIPAVPALVQALGDGDADVREAAAAALGRIGDAAAVPALVPVLRDGYADVREAAAAALGQIGAPAVPALVQALGDGDANVRRAAAAALGQIGDAAAVPALVRALGDGERQVREAAAAALGQIGDAQAVPALVRALKYGNALVRWAAAAALGKIGAPAVPALVRALRDGDWKMRRAAAEALGAIGNTQVVPALVEVLGDENWYVRRAAAAALGQIGDAQTVPALVRALGDEEWEVRWAAAAALGQIGDVTAVPALVQSLSDAEWWVRRIVVEALGEIGDVTAVPALVQSLGDTERWVRLAAARVLQQIGTSAIPVLIVMLGDAKWEMRRAAVMVLGEIGDAAAIPELLIALDDVSAEVREAAAEALGKIGDAMVVPELIRVLGDADGKVREVAAVFLGEIGCTAAVTSLIGVLDDKEWLVRRAAAEALGEIGDAVAVLTLIRTLSDREWLVRTAAAAALGKIGDVTAVPALVRALSDAKWEVRRKAAQALIPLLPAAPPADPQQRRVWQKGLDRMQRIVWRRVTSWLAFLRRDKEEDYNLLATILERQAAWHVALDSWQDPLQPPPVPVWQQALQRIGWGGLVVLLAGLAGMVAVLLAGLGEAVSAAWWPWLQAQPWWMGVGLLGGLAILATLLGWLKDWMERRG